jgi:1-acyl-sn-glycerol-3-phosphate acyltransferase
MKRNRFYDALYPIFFVLSHLLFRLHVTGRENVPDGGALICANHSSWLDPILVMVAMPRKYQLHAMAKQEIMSWPVIGWVAVKCGVFGVDRGHADIGAVKTALTYLKGGEKLLIFPEGTRVSTEDAAAAKSGAAMMAVRCGVPLVPVYLENKKKLFHRTAVVIGEPIHPKVAGRKGTAEEYRAIAEETMSTVYALGGKK